MNHQIAKVFLDEELTRLRKWSYEELLKFMREEPLNTFLHGPDGKNYQMESQAFWDSGERDNIRVMVSVDDGGIRAFWSLTDSFIIAPDGSFVGEC